MKYKCPCCEYLTFEDEPNLDGSYEICPVCFWESDPIQNNDENYENGANGISLIEAKKNFHRFGAIKKEYITEVRKPLRDEHKEI